jgi:hypothetical protein
MEMSLKIIRSLGIQGGKNDKIDAKRIAHLLIATNKIINLIIPKELLLES